MNGTGGFIMKATRVGEDTMLSQIVKMVSEAQRKRAPIQRLADTISAWFVPAVVVIAVITFIVWSSFGRNRRWRSRSSTPSLFSLSPVRVRWLATPMSIMVGTVKALKWYSDQEREALETFEKVDTIVVDKTGTLTEGHPKLVLVEPQPTLTEAELLTLAASVEKGSEHPLAAAIVAGAEERGAEVKNATGFASVTGEGVEAEVDGYRVALGNAKMMKRVGAHDEKLVAVAEDHRREGQTVMFVAVDGQPAGLIGVADPIKETTPEAIRALHAAGVKVVMLTGDSRATAEAVGAKIGIDEIHADVSPEDKNRIVRELQDAGAKVAMAGDGINDAPALAQADVGIAMGTGTDVAMESAGVTLVKGDLRGVARARRLSQATMRNIRQNLFFAFVYNALGVPVAAGVLYPVFGLLLSPMIAAAAMSFSSVSVIGNALRLRGLKL
ncbi:MAG: heavy metal translocating P-type ATPase [Parvularculaceae bacterium]